MLTYKVSFSEDDVLEEKRLRKLETVDKDIEKEFQKGYNLVVIDRNSFFFINNNYYLLRDDLD